MQIISATNAKQSFGAMLDAAQREPVIIRKQDRDVAILISTEEYQKLRGLRTAAFNALCDQIAEKAAARGLTEEKFNELMKDV